MGVLENYAKYVDDNGIKQTFISERSGIGQQKVNKLLNQINELKVEDFVRLCKAVRKTPNYFLDIEDKLEFGIELEEREKKEYLQDKAKLDSVLEVH